MKTVATLGSFLNVCSQTAIADCRASFRRDCLNLSFLGTDMQKLTSNSSDLLAVVGCTWPSLGFPGLVVIVLSVASDSGSCSWLVSSFSAF